MQGCTDEKRLLCPDHRVAEQKRQAVDGLDPRAASRHGNVGQEERCPGFPRRTHRGGRADNCDRPDLSTGADRRCASACRNRSQARQCRNSRITAVVDRVLTSQPDRQTGTALENRRGTDQPTITTKSEDLEYLPAASSWQGITTALRQPGRTASGAVSYTHLRAHE